VCRLVSLSVCLQSVLWQTADWIRIPFRMVSEIGRWMCVLDGGGDRRKRRDSIGGKFGADVWQVHEPIELSFGIVSGVGGGMGAFQDKRAKYSNVHMMNSNQILRGSKEHQICVVGRPVTWSSGAILKSWRNRDIFATA